MPEHDLDEIADELYALPPAEFVAARTGARDRVRGAGDRELATAVAALQRPTIAAWVCNLLVRRRPDEVARLVELGDLLRRAQVDLSAGQLRELGRRRNQVVAALVQQARGLARAEGHDVSSAVAEQVASTLRAAVADPDAGDALRAGRLTTALTYSGLGPVDLSGAVALPVRSGEKAGSSAGSPGKAPGKVPAKGSAKDSATSEPRSRPDRGAEARAREAAERRRREVEQARRDAEDAAGVARDAAAAAEVAAERLAEAGERRNELHEQADRLAEELRAVERQVAEAVTAVREAEHGRDAAARRAQTAAAISRRSAARVERLEAADE